MDDEEVESYTSDEVAELFSVNRATVSRWARLGQIPSMKYPTRRRRVFPKREVDELWARSYQARTA